MGAAALDIIDRVAATIPVGELQVEPIEVLAPEQDVKIPVTVIPRLDPITFTVERSMLNANGTKIYEVAEEVFVKDDERVVTVYVRPILAEYSVTEEIQLSASATGTQQINAEVKAGVEAKGNVGVAEVSANGSVTAGSQFSLSGTLGASKIIKLEMKFKVVSSFKIERKT